MALAPTKVLVAMSGGVDSSVAAGLLRRAGHEVVGCFMRLGAPGETLEEETGAGPTRIGHRGCCSVGDAADARLVAAELNIPFYVLNFRRDFARVMDYFADQYAAGRTPNPCVRCNDWLKFGVLRRYARRIGATHIASGHYARMIPTRRADGSPGHGSLWRGVDRGKDQSYVLFGVPRRHLARMVLPIGGMEKPRVRELAARLGLPVCDKPDSQEICFVPGADYAPVIEQRHPELARAGGGEILDAAGRVLGRHRGHHHYTIGQRRGVGLALGYPIYVVGKDPARNTLTVGAQADLLAGLCHVGEANWLVGPGRTRGEFRCLAQYRAHGDAVPALAWRTGQAAGPTPSGRLGSFCVRFESPQPAVAPGQAIVLYDPDRPARVLGGGWVTEATRPGGPLPGPRAG
ncbi:MAG TPA: tRNA 2-thiouridine(34) synthase MnmA [Phycisphaerales bacterium]|nr:tRNA 2-thiouridine(34) synthase MnmA [Phycisphaerales bacterium]